MKRISFLLISVLILNEVTAQCNNPFFRIKDGTVIVMESYNSKEKLQTRSETNVTSFNETSSGYVANIAYKILDGKQKVLSEGEYQLECDNGVIRIDMSRFVPAESMTAFQSMEVEMTMDKLEYPASLEVGQTLSDANFEIATKNSPIPMKLVFDIKDRKVEGKESITTPAGTFDCFKITYNTHSKMMMTNINYMNVEYLSDQFGSVKTETYKSNGSLVGYTMLVKYEY